MSKLSTVTRELLLILIAYGMWTKQDQEEAKEKEEEEEKEIIEWKNIIFCDKLEKIVYLLSTLPN